MTQPPDSVPDRNPVPVKTARRLGFWKQHPEYGSAAIAAVAAILSAFLASWWTASVLAEDSARKERAEVYIEFQELATDLSRVMADWPAITISTAEGERIQKDGDRAVVHMGERLDRLLFRIFIYGSTEAYAEAEDVVESMPIAEMHIGAKKTEIKRAYLDAGFDKTTQQLTEFSTRMCLELPAKPHDGCAGAR
jgi:ElaB/YqjD/DUF883 family membrane-anchored ribosome-binding protein